MPIDLKRPNGYKGKTGVDISPHNRSPRAKSRAPKTEQRRKSFFSEEDVAIGHLAGAHALKSMILEAHKECVDIKDEMMGIVGRYIPKKEHRSFDYIHILTDDCSPSPIGLCVVDFVESPGVCMFCKLETHNK